MLISDHRLKDTFDGEWIVIIEIECVIDIALQGKSLILQVVF